MMLVTTSRKPSQFTRSVARALAKGFGSAYLNRGKAGMDAVLGHAEKLGISHVLFVWEKKGNPGRLVAFNGEWLKPEIGIKGVVFPRTSFRSQGAKIVAGDSFGRKIRKLFLAVDGSNQILLSGLKLKILYNSELLLELRFTER